SGNGFNAVADDLIAAQHEAARRLSQLGARVREAEVPALRHSLPIWSAMMQAAATTKFSELMAGGREFGAGRELARLALGRSPHTLPAIGLALLERVP